jgi:hypothetical protein
MNLRLIPNGYRDTDALLAYSKWKARSRVVCYLDISSANFLRTNKFRLQNCTASVTQKVINTKQPFVISRGWK